MIEISVEKLSKRIDGRDILKSLSLSIERGSVYGLLGRNGAGKTTLIKHLLGLLRPDAGTVRVLGKEMFASDAADRQDVSYVSEGALYPAWARVADVIELEQRCRVHFASDRLDSWLKTQRIDRRKKVAMLSKGESKRLEIEIALASRPKVLILDEPFSGLDPVSRAEAIEALVERIAEGTCAILSSHVLSDLERLCERIGVLAHGRITLDVTLDDLKSGGAIVKARSRAVLSTLRLLGSRETADGVVAVAVGLVDDAAVRALEADGAVPQRGALDELGVELIRCAEGEGSATLA